MIHQHSNTVTCKAVKKNGTYGWLRIWSENGNVFILLSNSFELLVGLVPGIAPAGALSKKFNRGKPFCVGTMSFLTDHITGTDAMKNILNGCQK